MLLILFQSCYTYKTIDFDSEQNLENKKVKVNLKNSQYMFGKVIKHSDESIMLKNSYTTKEFYFTDIEKAEIKSFSTKKTILNSTASIIGGYLFFELLIYLFGSLFNGISLTP